MKAWFVFLCAWLLVLPGCNPQQSGRTFIPLASASSPKQESIRFENVAQDAGIDFELGHHGHSPLSILETAGGGCAFLDYDQDGWPDVLLAGPHHAALYHNLRNGKFKDVTAASGIVSNRYWMGCAVGDYDGDGLPDIILTGYHCCALYHNLGNGKFKDVTRESGIAGLDWSLSAVFADLTGSGRLDIYVSQYVEFNASTAQLCHLGSIRSACGPEVYKPLSGKLFVNRGGGRFQAVAWKDTGKTWGALASDILGTGRPALYLANDMMPGDLWVRQSGRWQNQGIASGTAYDVSGRLQGGMGVDSGDYDNDGRLDLLVTTYFQQPLSLYHNDGGGLFSVVSSPAGLEAASAPYVKFGGGFADFDNDGWLDIFTANGHVRDNVHFFDSAQSYAQPIQLFHNRPGSFEDSSSVVSALSKEPIVGRGVAFGDYDRDGRIDVLICNLEGHALLLHNLSPARHWLAARVVTPGPNRHGLGTLITVQAGKIKMLQEIRTCGSVLSSRDSIAHFGLGDYASPVTLNVRWPDGSKQLVMVNKTDREITIKKTTAKLPLLTRDNLTE